MKCLLFSAIDTVIAETISSEYNLSVNTGTDTLINVDTDQFMVHGEDYALPIGGYLTGYPPENLLDEHPKRVTKAPTSTVRYTFTINGASDWCVLGNTNARYVRCRVIKGSSLATGEVVHDEIKSLGGIDTYLELIQDSGQALYEVGFDYTYIYEEHIVILDLDTGNAEIPVPSVSGIVQIGNSYTFGRDVDKGLDEGLVDYSISKELSNGAFFYKKRDIVRLFRGTIMLQRDREFYIFMHKIFREIGSGPIFWRITNLENEDWLVYARAEEMPSGSHDNPQDSVLNFNLVEVL